ncbi:hypothetical protein HXY32_02590 [Candidatus Bathyarchaeota archaeon]|nr:hypothetical protein [Candidatus Bathyarchaeota archaeon]
MKLYAFSVFIVVCVIPVPVTAYSLGEWNACWSHALLVIVFGVLVVLLKTRYYWEEDCLLCILCGNTRQWQLFGQ